MIDPVLISGRRAFYTITLGQLLSTIGSSMTRFGLGIWVFMQTQDAAAYSTLLFFAILPLGLGSLFAGPLVDRLDRKVVMISANVIASASTLTIAALHFADALELWHVHASLLVNGAANAFILPALESSIPLMVPREELGKASGLTQLVQALETILAPALAGITIAALGLGALFVVDALTFVASIVAILGSRIPNPPRELGQEGVWAEFVFGIRYVLDRPAFLTLMSYLTLAMFLLPGVGYALVTPLVLTFSTEQAAGVIVSCFGFGSLVGGIGLTVWGGPSRRMTGILVAMMIAGLGTALVGLRESEALMAVGFIITGASFIFVLGLNRVVWQVKAAPDVLGRVFALRVALGVGAQSLGVLIAGPLAQHVFEPMLAPGGPWAGSFGMLIGVGAGAGMRAIYIVLGITLASCAALGAFVPAVRELEDRIPDHVPDS